MAPLRDRPVTFRPALLPMMEGLLLERDKTRPTPPAKPSGQDKPRTHQPHFPLGAASKLTHPNSSLLFAQKRLPSRRLRTATASGFFPSPVSPAIPPAAAANNPTTSTPAAASPASACSSTPARREASPARNAATHCGRARIMDISPDCQHEEHPAQHVLAFGDPRHRFHPQRMDGRTRARDKRAKRHSAPVIWRRTRKSRITGCCMEQDIGEMMSGPGM